MKFGSLEEIVPIEVKSTSTKELFTLSRSLTNNTGITDFSVAEEELPPGHRTSSPHWHSKKDEMYLVLSGTPSVYINGEKKILKTGDYIVFKSGLKEVHYLTNETEECVKLLMINSCPPDDVINYVK